MDTPNSGHRHLTTSALCTGQSFDITNTSGDENHLCGVSLRESHDFFESTKACLYQKYVHSIAL